MNDSLNNNSRSSILDRSFTRSPGVRIFLLSFFHSYHLFIQQSNAAAAAATQQARALQEDLFKVQYEFDDLQHKYGGLEKSYNELSKNFYFSILFISFLIEFQEEKNRELSEKVFRQADYDTIKDERNKLREDVHRYEIENKR